MKGHADIRTTMNVYGNAMDESKAHGNPGHYTRDNEIPRHGHVVGQISQTPLKSARMEALFAIAEATSLYGNIPQELPINGLAA